MKWLRSFENFAKDPDEMCHASWLANIGLFTYGWLLFFVFGWAFLGLCSEYNSVGPRISFLLAFTLIMALAGLFFILGGAMEMYLKAFVVPRMKSQNA